jgi:uncharacterized protein YlxP (DUF503 family)
MGYGYVGTLTVDLHLPVGGSLKAKRKELLRVKSGLARRFSCAVAEVDHHDLWQRSRLSLAVVCREASEAGRLVEGASRWLHSDEVFTVVGEVREVRPVAEDEDALGR